MDRRTFLRTVIFGALGGAHSAAAQQLKRLPAIGFLGVDPVIWGPWTQAFVDRLSTHGWIDGKSVRLEFRWAKGQPALHAQFANEFVKLRADVIWAPGAALAAVADATNSTIPIVFVSNDAIATGLIKSLARPSGNATGISLQTNDTAIKRYELFRETLPNCRRLAVMTDANFTQSLSEMYAIRNLAIQHRIECIPLEIHRTEDIRPAFDHALRQRADALYVVINELLNANRSLVLSSATEAKLPSMFGTHDWVRSGGLMSFGPNFPSLWARTADMIDKILRGTNPENIPVEQPTRFELVINLKVAKELAINIPPAVLSRADDVIE